MIDLSSYLQAIFVYIKGLGKSAQELGEYGLNLGGSAKNQVAELVSAGLSYLVSLGSDCSCCFETGLFMIVPLLLISSALKGVNPWLKMNINLTIFFGCLLVIYPDILISRLVIY